MVTSIFGFVGVSNGSYVPYRFKNGTITLFFGHSGQQVDGELSELVGDIMGENETILYKLSLPLKTLFDFNTSDGDNKRLYGTFNLNVDFYISKYRVNSTYNKMIFSFRELDYFIPSTCMFKRDEDGDKVIVSLEPVEIARFDFNYSGKKVAFVLRLISDVEFSVENTAVSKSELILEFENTVDLNFIDNLYHLIRNLFSFICNRKNLSFSQATLRGQYIVNLLRGTTEEGSLVKENKTIPTEQTMNIIDKFAEDWETDKSINKELNYGYLMDNFNSLLNLMATDKITVASIHSSKKAKNLIDLKQSLHITAAFEFYQRSLPEISSAETIEVYNEIKELINKYAQTQTDNKKTKKAKQIMKSLMPPISLKDKIVKVYNGYSSWEGVQGILDEWFKDKVEDLAQVANEWRNELAHEKNKYQPDIRVVDAIRLVEHLNYCIVLRQAGFTDSQIKNYLEIVLTR